MQDYVNEPQPQTKQSLNKCAWVCAIKCVNHDLFCSRKSIEIES